MNFSILLALLIGALALSWGLTALVRRYAPSAQMLDVPNERISHTVPTPHRGGVAIVLSFVLLVLVLGAFGVIEPRLAVACAGGSAAIALLGFLDDRSSLPARRRFLGHATAAAWVLWWVGDVPKVPLFGTLFDLSYAGPALCPLCLVWMINLINLINFMDFIGGIASVEAITTALGGAVLWWLIGVGTSWLVTVLFVGCAGGFLVAFIEHGQLKRKMGSRA